MKVWMIREREYAEYGEEYCQRLFEQGYAIPAKRIALGSDEAMYWLKKLKEGMEDAERAEDKRKPVQDGA